MSLVVDAHAHILPDPYGLSQRTRPLRERARGLLSPLFSALHQAQTWIRVLPEPVRGPMDQLSSLAALPSLALASTQADFQALLDQGQLDAAVVIAHPPVIPNDFVLELAQQDPRLIPVVNLGNQTHHPASTLKRMAKEGARALKIHSVADGLEPSAELYTELLDTAAGLGMPVIVHTGCIHITGRDAGLGRAERFAPWFSRYPDTPFVLAHMNYHEPGVALDLAEDHPNVRVDTSWQPTETIAEAVRRIGAERVLFGSDWPFVGQNIEVGLQRVREATSSGLITQEQQDAILGLNAAALFGWKAPTP